ncbi:uncharacterized protein A4U43_C04F15990 [Asparagus officinalis]|uniref:Uncharacterized protein n=1 Tax=Asparagus officinalis TaxID=4686 RepID=A0A5P1F308_ASPOF|nr:uncharacterized protein LOC109835936 [Asparagus officinalis]ONK72123.1 uncharacterized protein A4U43_C04F15990 [Asparagus officinalis]
MKNLKQVISVLVAMAKGKSTAVKSKTSAMKTRLMLFKILHDKKTLMSVLSQKVHSVKADENVNDYDKAVIEYKSTHSEMAKDMEEEEGEDDYPYLMDPIPELDEFDDKFADIGLENEIDKAADLFIRRFHRQIKIQKQESFKRYQEMLERSM